MLVILTKFHVRLGVTRDAGAKFAQRSDNARRRQRRQHFQRTVVHGDLGRKLIIKSMSYLCELAIKSFTSLPISDLSKRLVILDLGHRKDALLRSSWLRSQQVFEPKITVVLVSYSK